MAISKILYIKDTGKRFPGKHLKNAIEYITVPEKTCGGRLVAGHNCLSDYAYEQMRATKLHFDKTDKRQGYHIVLSFAENEVSPEKAFEIVGKFVERYIGNKYEAVYAVHDNTDHVHGHIIFNSVSCLDGKKFRYEKGDWEKYIQPITNELCKEYGLSTISVQGGEPKSGAWHTYRDGRFSFDQMIKRDLDVCILQADNFDMFLELLAGKGYEIKQNKYVAVKPQGMRRYRRLYTLGEDYTEDRIIERIKTENITDYKDRQNNSITPKILRMQRVYVHKHSALTPLQKKYYAKLYRTGQLKKRPYSEAWKYKDEIRKIKQYQQQYLFLVHHNISSVTDLIMVCDGMTDRREILKKERSRFYKARAGLSPLFDIADRMEELTPAYDSYIDGDMFFAEEYQEYIKLKEKLEQKGYSLTEIQQLKEHYRVKAHDYSEKSYELNRELRTGHSILSELEKGAEDIEYSEHIKTDFQQTDKERNNDDKQQPKR